MGPEATAIYSDVIPRAAEYGALVFVLFLAVFALGSGAVFLARYILKTMTDALNNNTKAWLEVKGVLDDIKKNN